MAPSTTTKVSRLVKRGTNATRRVEKFSMSEVWNGQGAGSRQPIPASRGFTTHLGGVCRHRVVNRPFGRAACCQCPPERLDADLLRRDVGRTETADFLEFQRHQWHWQLGRLVARHQLADLRPKSDLGGKTVLRHTASCWPKTGTVAAKTVSSNFNETVNPTARRSPPCVKLATGLVLIEGLMLSESSKPGVRTGAPSNPSGKP